MSSVWSTTAVDPVRGALGDASASLDAVVEAAMWSMTPTDITDAVTAAHQLMNRVHGMIVRLVTEAEVLEVPAAAGAPNAVQWLKSRLRVGQGEANGWVQTTPVGRPRPVADP